MRRDNDAVEIKEPPLKHLKRGSCLKRCCVWGTAALLAVLVSFILLLRYAAKPHPKELAGLPPHFPSEIPVYDPESIDQITILVGKDRGKIVERFALLPKAIIAPIFASFGDRTGEQSFWGEFMAILHKPVTDHRDVIDITWSELSAQPKFLQSFFQTKLEEAQYDVMIASETNAIRQFTFSKDGIDGVVYIRDNADTATTDELRMTVRIWP